MGVTGYSGPRRYDESRWRRESAPPETETTTCQHCGEPARLGSSYLSTIDGETTIRRMGICTRKVKRREPKCPPTILSEVNNPDHCSIPCMVVRARRLRGRHSGLLRILVGCRIPRAMKEVRFFLSAPKRKDTQPCQIVTPC